MSDCYKSTSANIFHFRVAIANNWHDLLPTKEKRQFCFHVIRNKSAAELMTSLDCFLNSKFVTFLWVCESHLCSPWLLLLDNKTMYEYDYRLDFSVVPLLIYLTVQEVKHSYKDIRISRLVFRISHFANICSALG